MGERILLFESRDLCYESNHYFMEQLEQEFQNVGYETEICDLSVHAEEKLEEILNRRQEFSAALDFNSRLTRAELEDGTPYIDALGIPFFNYLVDHPLYHHGGLKREFQKYSVICIDECHREYIKKYYPHIKQVFLVPLGAMRAGRERTWEEKRFEVLFLGTYVPVEDIYGEIMEYPPDRKKEAITLIQWMEAEPELNQEDALARYLLKTGEELTKKEFAKRLHSDYIVDRYLRFSKRKNILLAAVKSGIPLTVMGHGLEEIPGLYQRNVNFYPGVGFAVSAQMIADAKILLNITPGFYGGVHDRVYSARINRTLCLTEKNRYTINHFEDGQELVLYDEKKPEEIFEQIGQFLEDQDALEKITEKAYKKAVLKETWQCRGEEIAACFQKCCGIF
ncbi:MAG: glycosyltransferase [Roseburia sp.]|nr:glycosyltransferase [Roseburia sp.]